MDEHDWLAGRFEAPWTHPRVVAYRMLGSPSEADAAVQAGAAGEVCGALDMAKQFSGRARLAQPALVNGAVGVVVAPRGRLFLVFDFTITGGTIAAIDVVADPARLRQIDLAILDG